MLSADEKGRPVASRVKGWPVVIRGLRRDFIRVDRFARARARTAKEQMRCARVMDALSQVIAIAEGDTP